MVISTKKALIPQCFFYAYKRQNFKYSFFFIASPQLNNNSYPKNTKTLTKCTENL